MTGYKSAKAPKDSPTARQKFIDAARRLGAEDGEAFDRALKKVASAPPPKTIEKRKDKKPPKQ